MGRPHGTGGAVAVVDPTDRNELLDPGRVVVVGGRELRIAGRRGTAARPIVVFEGVHDRAAAEQLRGADIAVPREALGPLGEGEFLVDDLIGCAVADGERPVGRVEDVLLLPSTDALEVTLDDGQGIVVPLIGDAVRAIDIAARRVDVDMRFVLGEQHEDMEAASHEH